MQSASRTVSAVSGEGLDRLIGLVGSLLDDMGPADTDAETPENEGPFE
jgi:hypothetical protein